MDDEAEEAASRMHSLKTWRLAIALGVALAGCAPHPLRTHEDTQACMTYRAMMTAPMPPDAMHRLRQQCDASRQANALH